MAKTVAVTPPAISRPAPAVASERDVLSGLSMILVPADVMRRVSTVAALEGLSPVEFVSKALVDRLEKVEAEASSGRTLPQRR